MGLELFEQIYFALLWLEFEVGFLNKTRHLAKKKMPERDAFWLPFINNRYEDEGAVNRLLAWAWEGGDKSKIQNDSLRLAGVTLAWFLASSNRFLRDRATKALVSMFDSRIPVLLKVLEDFKGIDDPYRNT